MSVKNKFGKLALLSMLPLTMAVTSCDNIFEDNDDCTLYCRIKFKYDMNMKFADAFANSVNHVALCVYDAETGKLVHKQVESGEALSNQDYVMQFDELTCGTYDMIAWCGDGLREGNFQVPEQIVGASDMTTATCTMEREEGAQVTKDVKQLFHGKKRITIPNKYGVYNDTIPLTKNTNTVRVILQHLSGIDVDKDQFRFEIKDDNGKMDYDNSLLPDDMLTYRPWAVDAGSAGVDADIYGTRAQTSVSVAIAEFTVARLMTDKNPILSVYNTKDNDKLVLSIPLKDYALLVKGNYNRKMDDQEYLDRQDEYNLTFFLDEFGNWATSRIIINSWSVVLQDFEL
ncbi:MAG: FimB/Mfa2 family fimbrial subunit [Bacteroidaceae bacterium]|nr:FimB/Mfa2 family fimbrial subunit [Bacteroidaceae bacterium]